MKDIHIDKPMLNRKTPQENIALIDRWLSDTADKLNLFIDQYNRERSSDNAEQDANRSD